jgi:protein O-GlcNAc transferase
MLNRSFGARKKCISLSLSSLEDPDNCSSLKKHRKGIKVQRSSTKVDELFQRACAYLNKRNLAEAERLYKQILRVQPKHLGALNLLGILLAQLDRNEEAERYIRAALSINPGAEATQYNYGTVLKKLKRLPEALTAFENALALNADAVDAWSNRGTVLNELERFEEALSDFDQAVARKPDFADGFYNKGNALRALKRNQAAVENYDHAIRLNPCHAGAYNNRGVARLNLRQFEQALADFDRAIGLQPDAAEYYVGRGDVCVRLMRLDEAAAAFEQSLALNPNLAEAWRGRGLVFSALRRFEDALAAYDRAIATKSDFSEAWLNRAQTLFELGRHQDALLAFERAWEINPDLKIATLVLTARMLLCDWRGYEEECARVISGVRAGTAVSPFVLLSLPSSSEDQLSCARAALAEEFRSPPGAVTHRQYVSRDRIRVGYLSFDLRNHAVGFLTVGLFEHHDRSRFETIALSLCRDDGSQVRKRLEVAFDHFYDVSLKSDDEIARLIRKLEIDIAVDLNGFTQGARVDVLACRPAPIQVNYLGYPGTMGADYIDYIIADRIVIPQDQQPWYSENVVYLPHCYQANDDRRAMADVVFSRAEVGLPDRGFVFCSFNNTFKINPPIFDIWMRLLREIDGSVLWLLEGNANVPDNLRREAERRGVAANRLVFAPRMKSEEHVARQILADLFLDTLPYNAHTTASDALWVGLPVLTCLGSTFAGRVAASLLHAVGLSEMVTHSTEEYEAVALRLARSPELLASVKAKLVRNRETFPLFDTARFARNIEAAYTTMWERYQRGRAGTSFDIEP